MSIETPVQANEPQQDSARSFAENGQEENRSQEQTAESKKKRKSKPFRKPKKYNDTFESAYDDDLYFKVYVGNLSFKIEEKDFKVYFGQVGQVLEAIIAQRGDRSAGYGFVTYETAEEADDAVRLLGKTHCLDRPISVERLSVRNERLANERMAKNRARKNTPKAEGSETQAGDEAKDVEVKQETEEGAAKPRPKRKNNRRRKPAAKKEENDENEPAAENSAEKPVEKAAETEGETAGDRKPRRKPRRVSQRKPRVDENGQEIPLPPRKPRAMRPRGPPSDKSLFIANLPFSLTDADLKDCFKDYEVVSAHAVKRHGYDYNKGYGFVVLANHEEQVRAFETAQSTPIVAKNRSLTVKIALDEVREEQAQDAEPARIDAQ